MSERERLRQDIDCAVQGHLSRESEDALVAVALAYAERRVAEAVAPLQKRLDDFDRKCTWYWDVEDPEECILEPAEHLDNGPGCGVIVELQRGGVFEMRWWFQYLDEETEEYTTVSFASKEEAEAALIALSPAREGGE